VSASATDFNALFLSRESFVDFNDLAFFLSMQGVSKERGHAPCTADA
jgi:hypothetical protein